MRYPHKAEKLFREHPPLYFGIPVQDEQVGGIYYFQASVYKNTPEMAMVEAIGTFSKITYVIDTWGGKLKVAWVYESYRDEQDDGEPAHELPLSAADRKELRRCLGGCPTKLLMTLAKVGDMELHVENGGLCVEV